jgi:carotenoid cleavage dioxygenase
MTRNAYLEGNFAPVTEEVTSFGLTVRGTIPRDLDGRLLRIGPNPVTPPDPAKYHWFLGNGMVHGLRLRDGKAEWYRNRFVRDDEVTAAKSWEKTAGPRRGMLGSVANTNVIGHAGRYYAIVEGGGGPVELDGDLGTVAYSDFGGTLTTSFTAHPKRDPDTGELHAIVYAPGREAVDYVVVGTDGRVRKSVDVKLPGSPMVHDCAITERYVLIFDLPVTFKLSHMEKGAPFPYAWDPEYGARVGLLPRDGDASQVKWLDVPLCYVFHPLNAYETANGQVVLDVCRHPKMFATDPLGPNEGRPTLDRWILDPSSGKVAADTISDLGHEFPRHDERRIGKAIRYGYTGGLADKLGIGPIYKHDLANGKTETHDEGPGRMFLEPVFVPRTPDADEDDGYVLAYVYDAKRNGSDVVILAAQDFAAGPLATIELPQRVPFGFHGNWVPTERGRS